ncbi:LOW QUALITY PROTEIN: hypothetical protein PanWU01x14_194440, partial [Parasponia andersonii]
ESSLCGHCGRHLGNNSRNGKYLHDYLDKCLGKEAQNITDPNKTIDGSPALTISTFDPEVVRRKLTHMIILREYLLSTEHVGFIKFLNFDCPSSKWSLEIQLDMIF